MRKILFLDIDGVLNIDFGVFPQKLDDSCLQQLKRIVDTTGAEIVLSSSWRFSDASKLIIIDAFHRFGIPVWTATTLLKDAVTRGQEIHDWFMTTPGAYDPNMRFAILDDEPDANHCGRLVLCDQKKGITEEIANRVIHMLSLKAEVWYQWYEINGEGRFIVPWSDPMLHEWPMDWLFETPEKAKENKAEFAPDENWVLVKVVMEQVE
jgi:hypothetical protein